jgi:integrase/recombinase XerD
VRVVARPQATTLRGAIEEYRDYLVALNRSRHTRESFALDLKLLLEHLGDAQLSSIGERDLRSFISHVRLQRKNSATSVRRKVASLKNFFSYLHRERAIASDPSLRLIYPEIYPALPEFLEDDKAESLLVAAAEHLSWHALIALMLETGLKRDEVVALGRVDVHLAREEAGSYLVVRETQQAKRLRSRRLDIGPETAALLRRFLADEPPRERFFDLSPRGVNFIVETCGKRAHIITRGPRLTPQVLRETFAVRHMRAMVADEERLRAAGLPAETVAMLIEQHDLQLLRLLGLHEEPESAKKYRKLVHGWTEASHPPAEA